ncbi:hypothetical protein PPN31119_04553 [Pandoraea pnomenusa]|uniref:Uncharacterized protein n=1 Tax=Pandoraea pnomenusa TaxID=93220 RepID=A0ABY6WQA6_9BURK|nr:hypothetical protein PPN31119_04553 [Pandoraea pnomenusa]
MKCRDPLIVSNAIAGPFRPRRAGVLRRVWRWLAEV